MEAGGERALAWERRWALPVGLATFGAIALLIASVLVAASLGGGGEAESLRSVHENSSSVTLSSVLQAAGFVLLAAPLVFLFRAALARSDRMRSQFLPLVVAAPLALAVASVLNGAAANEAGNDFAAGRAHSSITQQQATRECRQDRSSDPSGFRDEYGGGAPSMRDCASTKIEDDEAQDAIDSASMRPLSEGFRFGGALGLGFALVYGCLYGLRTGLLSRFWGSLGMALGVAAALGIYQFAVIWFIYFGLLAAGWVPRGRPPAWAAGRAVPWPTPGERAAAEISTATEKEPAGQDAEADGEETRQDTGGAPPVGGETPPRKRKQRD